MTLAAHRRLAGALGLGLGFGLDQLLGDPRRGHPVAGFGLLAGRLERRIWADRRVPGLAYVAVLVGGAAGLWLPLPGRADLNLNPLNRWREPDVAIDIRPRSGPILVEIEYRIREADVPEFLAAMAERQRFTRMRSSQGRSGPRLSKRRMDRKARTKVSCTASSASARSPSMRTA